MAILSKLSKLAVVITCQLWTLNGFTATKPTVNVLTWWGYLNPHAVQVIQDQCGVELAHDDYRSNDDLIRRWNSKKEKYDILIFSDTVFNLFKDQIFLPKSKVYLLANAYYPAIRQQYMQLHLPHNVAFFAHSIAGFLWNPEVIHLSENDSISQLFAKAKKNKVIFVDNPVEVDLLLQGQNKTHGAYNSYLSLKNLQTLTADSQVFISSETNQLYIAKDFAFAYTWSGGALATQNKTSAKYKFIVNKNLSYISSDLIAQLKDNQATRCAVNILAGEEFLSSLHRSTFYFSSYGNISTLPEGEYKNLYRKFLDNANRLKWTNPNKKIPWAQLNRDWNNIKYEYAKKRK